LEWALVSGSAVVSVESSVAGKLSDGVAVSDAGGLAVLVELVCAPPLLLTTTPGATCELAVVVPDAALPAAACSC
jgi:hypothetical protein